ncbi:MAG: ZPR1 zinc finger domain-containing protein [Candidatus Nanoarchaeia archaeon]|nr:ZPR1 zinc finger domain-containing protein [Candidatus Nanoarchaeia archaeon]
MEKPETIENQECPICKTKNLSMTQEEIEIPFFGKTFVFSMTCSNCKYHVADVEAAETKEPIKQTIEISSEEDMKIRVIKSSQATIKIPHITTITPGPASTGYITNIEGILRRVKHQVEVLADEAEDNDEKKKAKKMIKKLNKVMWGDEKLKITIEDPSGNSAIISDKTESSKLR